MCGNCKVKLGIMLKIREDDVILEMRTSGGADLINDVMGIDSAVSASLLEHDGEATF